ncbi:I10R2 protein, partial [Phainopepla nitens]|nr:I10R2 protein [Phainopepla nitens]
CAASIGPPEVRLQSENGALHVDFWGPLAEHQDSGVMLSLRCNCNCLVIAQLIPQLRPDLPGLCCAFLCSQVDSSHSSEILTQLEPWTVYCVRVQAVVPECNKTGQLSRELCEQTTHNGETPVWVIVTVLVGSMLVVVTAVTVCFFSSFYLYRLTKYVFCPSYIFPDHLKEFLSKAPGAPQPFPPVSQEELLVCDQLTVISEQCHPLSEGSGASRSPEDSARGETDS